MSPRLPGPPPLDPATQAAYEAQAEACLLAAEQHRVPLLALARKLAGCPEAGMDLFQQTVLDCHDTIQRKGFTGTQYQFYLYTSLRNHFRKEGRLSRREVRVDFQGADSNSDYDDRDDEGSSPWAMQAQRKMAAENADIYSALAPEVDAHADLAEQVWAELRENYPAHERVAFRLLVEGYGYQQIAEMVGLKDRTWVWRRMEKMKASLRETFRQAWQALGEATYCLLP